MRTYRLIGITVVVALLALIPILAPSAQAEDQTKGQGIVSQEGQGGKVVATEGSWADEIANSLTFYKASYPNSNWDPYQQKLTLVREAIAKGDQRTVRTEMGKWFKMLHNRDHGINDVAADELYNFAVMVTPIQEYGISVPTSVPTQ